VLTWLELHGCVQEFPTGILQLTALILLSIKTGSFTCIPAGISKLTNLLLLYLSGNEQMTSLPIEISKLTSLEILDLCRTGLGEQGATNLAELLKTSHSLRLISMYGCPIGRTGTLILAQAMQNNPRFVTDALKSTEVVGCDFDDVAEELGLHQRGNDLIIQQMYDEFVCQVALLGFMLAVTNGRPWKPKPTWHIPDTLSAEVVHIIGTLFRAQI
jgi:hypothetical protein